MSTSDDNTPPSNEDGGAADRAAAEPAAPTAESPASPAAEVTETETSTSEDDGAAPADDDAGVEDSPTDGSDRARPDEPSIEPAPAVAAGPPTPSMLGAAAEGRSWLLELPDFEGPLDLLLHLVRRHELDILDIPIAFVTEKYLEYLEFMQALDLEVAGDYLVMAATLAYLKSRELVPTEPSEVADDAQTDAEGPDPREELIARLLEYQKYRAAASDLDVFGRGGEIELPPVDPGLAPLTLFRLAEAYHRVLDRARIHKSHDVVMETVSVAQRMQQLTEMLTEKPKVEFESLFLGRTWSSEAELRSMLVVTLMSVLELTKLGVITVRQAIGEASIVIERKASAEEAKQAIEGYDEAKSFGHAKPGVEESSESGEAAGSSDAPGASSAPSPSDDAEPTRDA